MDPATERKRKMNTDNLITPEGLAASLKMAAEGIWPPRP